MITEQAAIKTSIVCPCCNTDAVYRYGRAATGNQRFLCLICGKQFTNGSKVSEVTGKPTCPECGKSMHVYRIEGDIIRFRCAAYPECRNFRKFRLLEEKN